MDSTKRIAGVVVGIVIDIEDPEALGRIKVSYPWLAGEPASAWCRLVTPMAGDTHGLQFMPEIGDEAVVAFNNGVFEQPYVMGFTWNKSTELPAEELTHRTIKTIGENIIKLNDTQGEEGIEISDKHGNKVVLDKDGISISSDKDITITAGGKVAIEAGGELKAVGAPIELNP